MSYFRKEKKRGSFSTELSWTFNVKRATKAKAPTALRACSYFPILFPLWKHDQLHAVILDIWWNKSQARRHRGQPEVCGIWFTVLSHVTPFPRTAGRTWGNSLVDFANLSQMLMKEQGKNLSISRIKYSFMTSTVPMNLRHKGRKQLFIFLDNCSLCCINFV